MGIAEELIARVDADRAQEKAPRSSVIEEIIDRVDADKGPGFLKGAKDVAASAVIGLGNIPKAVTQIGEMATGGAPVFAKGTELIDDAMEWLREKAISDETLAQQRQIARTIQNDDAAWYDVVSQAFRNPAGAITQGAESLSSFAVPAGAGAGVVRGLSALGRALKPTSNIVARTLASMDPRKAQLVAILGTNALMNAGETFSESSEGDLADRYQGAGISAAASLLGSALTGGAAEKTLSNMILRDALTGGMRDRTIGVAKDAAKEAVQEFLEEGGNAVGSNVGKGEDINLGQALRQGTYGALLGAGTGGALSGVNALTAPAQRESSPTQVQATPAASAESQQAAANAATQISQMAQRERAPVESAPAPAPQPPVQTQRETQAPQAPVSAATETQPAAAETNQKVILQNRNRSSDASVQQMNAIAAKPNYLRVSGSRDFGNGAPVVAYGSVPQRQLGNREISVTADDERIPVQYAVVEAGDVLTSNQVNGSTNPEYETAPASRIRAIAGNGRVAGLTEAYRRGTASQYRAELREDATNLGIDPAVIDSMKAPILVRVMPADRVRADIGDISNTSGNLSMNAVETAANDVNRINFDKIVFNDNGEADIDTIIGFVRQMPIAEQGALIDTNGQPTRAAHERFANALFKKAYGDDELVRLSAQAVDPEIRNVIAALSRVAPKMARLEGLGDLDIRGLVKQAAQVVVNAHRQGVSLAKFAAQGDITMDPDVRVIVECFAQNARSVKEIARVLEIAADFAYSEGTKDDVDMFGTVERATRQDVLNRIQEETNGRQQQSAGTAANRTQTAEVGNQPARSPDLAEPAGAESSAQNVQREPGRTAANGRGSADVERTQENLQLTGQTEAEAQAEAARLQEIEDDERREREEAERRAREERIAKEERQAAERYRDEFKLEDDTVSADDAVSGQQGLMFSRASGDWKPETDLVSGIKEYFGTTWDPHESGYMMQDGDMLNMSGSHEIEDERTKRSVRGRRTVDHRDVSGTNARGVSTEHFFDDQNIDSSSDYMYNFMARTGAMRMDFDSGVAALSRQPTRSQLQMLQRMAAENDYLAVSYYTPEGRIVDEAEWEGPVTQKKIRDFFVQAGKKAARGVAGAYASVAASGQIGGSSLDALQDTSEASTASVSKAAIQNKRSESIRQSLSEDKTLGQAFTALEKAGVVEVVQSEEDLLRVVGKRTRKSYIHGYAGEDFTIDSPVSHAEEAWNKSGFIARLEGVKGVRDGNIHLTLGYARKEHAGRDIAHAFDHAKNDPYRSVENRSQDDLVDDLIRQTIDDLRDQSVHVYAQKSGEIILDTPKRAYVIRWSPSYGGYVIVTRTPSSDKNTKAKLASGRWADRGNASLSLVHEAYTANAPSSLSLHQQGRNGGIRAESRSVEFNDNSFVDNGRGGVKIDDMIIKRSENGSIQGAYDPATGKSYLIASNIKPGDEKGVLVHEVGVHMAADRGGREAMRPLIMRAKQIVYYGNTNGDATAKRVYQRMKDADLINSRGFIKEGFDEEAFAYLAEEIINSKEKASSPIREWFEKLLSAIRLWLYKRGLFVSAENLSDRDLVNIAVANVRTMAQQGIGSSSQNDGSQLAFSTRKDSQDENATPVDAVVQQRLDEGNSVWGWIRKDDGLGGHKFGAGEWVYNHAADVTRRLFNYIDEKSGHNFNLNMASKEFRQAFRKYRAEVDNARTDIATAAQAMQGMSEEERRLVSDVIEKMVAPGVNPSEHVVQVAASIQNLMDAQTDELVRLGLLSAESAERWRGQYLPRVYLKQTELFEEAKKNFREIFGSGEGIRGGHLKGRGLFRTVVGNQAIAQHKALGWEIRDPSWSDAQGELQFTGEGAEPRTPTVVMWRDFTPEERRQMGECRDAMVRMVMGYMQTQEDIALARFFDSLSRDTRFAASVPSEGWVRVPDSSIGDGSPVKRFGALAGMYVSPDVWAEIQHFKGDRSSMGRLARTLMAAWKEGKTALNPVAHVNNIVGNISLSYFAGAKALDPRTYMNAFRDIRTGAPMFKEAQRAGLLSGNFSRSEILDMIPIDEVRKNLTGMKPGYEKVIDTFMNVGSLGLRQKLRNAYELEDTVFKYIIYKWAREKGMSIEDAVDYSGQYIFNYDDLPSGARRIRDSILPFFSWTYKAVPMLLHTVMVYPHRYFAPAMMAFAVNQAAYLAIAASGAAAGDDWEDILKEALKLEDAEREALPEYAQGASIFRTPKFLRLWNNSDGTANFLDMSRLMPGGDLMDMNNQMGGIPWLQPLMPNSPQLGLFLSIFANKDAFTGREIVDRTDSFSEAFRKRLGYVYRNIAPSLAPGSYHFSRLGDAVAAASGTNLTVEPIFDFTGTDWNGRQMEMSRALAHTFGFKVRAFDWQQEVDRKTRKMTGEIRDKMGQVRYKAKARYLGAVSDEYFRDFAERTAADIKERSDKLKKFHEKVRPLLSKD